MDVSGSLRKVLKAAIAIIAGFLVAGVIVIALRFIGPAIGGGIVLLLKLSPNPDTAKDMEAVGNIVTLIVALYAGIKVCKKIWK